MTTTAAATREVVLPTTKSFGRQRFPSRTVAGASIAIVLYLAMSITFLLAASSARAENRARAFTISPFAGGQGFPFGGDSHYDGDFNWGIRAGYNFTERFGLEFVFSENETVHDPEVAFCTIHQYGVDALYFFQPEKKLVPFIAAGFGVFDVNFDGTFDTTSPPGLSPLSDETNPYFNYGAGVEYALTNWLSVRADLRHGIMLNSGDHSLQGVVGFRFQF